MRQKRSGPGEIVEILGLRLSKFFKFIGWLRIELKTAIFVMPYDLFESRQIQFLIWVETIFEKKIENEVYAFLIDRSIGFFILFIATPIE